MKHPLEIENEELEKRIEDTYNEITDIDCELTRYDIMDFADLAEQDIKNTKAQSYFTNTILANNQTFNDMIKWGNSK